MLAEEDGGDLADEPHQPAGGEQQRRRQQPEGVGDVVVLGVAVAVTPHPSHLLPRLGWIALPAGRFGSGAGHRGVVGVVGVEAVAALAVGLAGLGMTGRCLAVGAAGAVGRDQSADDLLGLAAPDAVLLASPDREGQAGIAHRAGRADADGLSSRSCGGVRCSRPRCWAGLPGTCPANVTTRLPPATTTRPSPPPATSRKAGPRRSPGCSSASYPCTPATGTPERAVPAEQATTRAADGSSHVVADWSAAFAAEAHALLGAERKARLLLERADHHLSKVTADDPMFGVFGREQLGGFIGACQLRLHDPTRAEAALQESARRLGAGKEKHQAVILADLSTAFVVQDDPEQACAVLHQVIDRVELTGSAAGKRRAFAAGRQLTRWRNEPFVQDVQDRLLALAS